MSPSRKRRSRNRFESIPDASPRPLSNAAKQRRIESRDPEHQYMHTEEENLGLFKAHSAQPGGLAVRNDSTVQDDGDSFFLHSIDSEAEQSDDRLQTESPDIELTQELSETGVKIPNWRVLWGLLMTNGNRKITKSQYQSVRVLAETLSRRGASSRMLCGTEEESNEVPKKFCALPHYSTLHTVFKPILCNYLIPRASVFREPVDVLKAGARAKHCSDDGNPETSIRVILPSEFARADVSTGPTFKAICSTSLQALESHDSSCTRSAAISASDCIDIWPLIAARGWYYGPSQSASVDRHKTSSTLPLFCEAGDTIQVVVLGHDPLPASLHRCFPISRTESDYSGIVGAVVHVWDMQHSCRGSGETFESDGLHALSQRDRHIIRHLRFISYCSPTDSVSVEIPELPVEDDSEIDPEDEAHSTRPRGTKKRSPQMAEATKRRRIALKQKKKEMEYAWLGWKKPLLKPSDVVVMLRPSFENCSSPATTARVFLVYRFWAEQDERTRHMFWIPGDSSVTSGEELHFGDPTLPNSLCAQMSTTSNENLRDVLSVTLLDAHPGERGPRKYFPVSSVGELDNGENYIIYRFLLFWDGFEISAGKSASGEGFYLVCLNFPVRDRSSPNSVRVLSLTPPGVKSDVVFKRIQDDLLKGITDGFLDIDANGETRRIFLDLVGFIGDTPAINATLDVLGHNASACCHQCRFLRCSSTLVGSRYTARSSHSFNTACGRSFYRHRAVRDSGAQRETCRLLGMKHIPRDAILPIHTLRSAMMTVRDQIPTTRGGTTIISAELDPYRGCLIAPDHVLTGHAKDIINLAFKLLPSRDHRVVCEGFMIGMLSDCGLPRQNRLLDHDKRSLYSKTMTEIYALLLVAELGFIMGCAKMESNYQESALRNEKTKSSLALVGAFSTLVAKLWTIPNEERDGKYTVAAFEQENGEFYVRQVQTMTTNYLEKVEAQCSMADSDVQTMEGPQCDSQTRLNFAKVHRACLIALKTIDKPNVHRLQELVFSTLPMVGHISRIGELVMEKAHQGLKSAIRRSNKKDVHLVAMESTALSDWQGRLTALSKYAILRDKDALRGCYRLFAGRESVFAIAGVLQERHIRDVLQVLGPSSCVPRELKNQACSILSPRSAQPQQLCWRFVGTAEAVHSRCSISTSTRRDTYDCILNDYRFETQMYFVRMCNAASSTLPNGIPGPSFQRGDVVETLCFHPHEMEYHFPFLMQAGDLRSCQHSTSPLDLSLWCISTLFSITRCSGSLQFFAAVQPCLPITDSTISTPLTRHTKYKVHTRSASSNATFSIARLNNTIRKVGIFHVCICSDCRLSNNCGTIAHCDHSEPLDSGVFFVLDRKLGFPPRQG